MKQSSSVKPKISSRKLRKIQPASLKPRAQRLKLQATSIEILDYLPLIKFYLVKGEGFNHDKSLVWMFHMKCKLMWREPDSVTSSNFEFYCEKGAINIIAQ